MAHGTSVLLTAAALLAAGAAAGYLLLREELPSPRTGEIPEAAGQPAARPQEEPVAVKVELPWTGHPEQKVLTNKPSPVPLHRVSRYPPYTRIPIASLPAVRDGILLPDGRRIPFLNGITAAPPLQRGSEFGPLPEVIGLMVDGDGFEWWHHADNSMTTTRYKEVTAHGKTYWDVATEHLAPQPDANLRPPDMPPPEGGNPGGKR